MCHHARLIFVYLVQMGFHHVGQVGLELLTSSDLPASAFQSVRITGLSHDSQPSPGFQLKLHDQFAEISTYILSTGLFIVLGGSSIV